MENKLLFEKVKWYNINKDGSINLPLNYKSAIYVYKKINTDEEEMSFYVGSAYRLRNRVNSHKYFVAHWEKYANRGSPLFYKSVLKYGWLNFKFGVLEHIDLLSITNIKDKRNIILEKEQFYLDLMKPSLNICGIAGSPLGMKRDEVFSINLSKSRRGRSINSYLRMNNLTKTITNETKLKISLRCKGISVRILDKNKNLIQEFSTLSDAAKYLGVNHKTLSMIYKTGKSYDDFIYEFSIKDTRIWICDSNQILINVLNNAKETSIYYNIPRSTLSDYIKSRKLYKNKFYFYNLESYSK